MGKRKPKPPGKCIFCGRTGLSKEHIWSDWLKTLIPSYDSHLEFTEGGHFEQEAGVAINEPLIETKRQGSPLQRKMRNVCKSHCNNGWMASAVEAAKPIATKLIQGATCYIENDDQANLVEWLAITTVMQEYIGSRTIAIPPEDRVWIMENNAPPSATWRMWIGYYGGQNWYPYGHMHNPNTGSLTALKYDGTKIDIPEFKLQISTFVLRRLLVHVFSADNSTLAEAYGDMVYLKRWHLAQLWPSTGSRIMWPHYPILDNKLSEVALGVRLFADGVVPSVGLREKNRI